MNKDSIWNHLPTKDPILPSLIDQIQITNLMDKPVERQSNPKLNSGLIKKPTMSLEFYENC